MRSPLVPALAVAALLLSPARAREFDPTALVTSGELGALFGVEFRPPDAIPAERDDEFGSIRHTAVYQSPQVVGSVVIDNFPSASTALAGAKGENVGKLVNADDPTVVRVTVEPGAGDRAFWLQGPDGCGYAVVKGQRMVSVVGTGKLPQPAESYRAKLRTLCLSVVGKL